MLKGTITVSSNISQQDMQQYLDGFNKKYPNIEVKYQSYSDYENEVSRQIVDRKDVELVQPKLEELVTRMCRTFSYGEDSVPLSISLGAVYVTKEFPYEELFKATDGVLYTVKEHGKNSFKIKNL